MHPEQNLLARTFRTEPPTSRTEPPTCSHVSRTEPELWHLCHSQREGWQCSPPAFAILLLLQVGKCCGDSWCSCLDKTRFVPLGHKSPLMSQLFSAQDHLTCCTKPARLVARASSKTTSNLADRTLMAVPFAVWMYSSWQYWWIQCYMWQFSQRDF